MYDRTLTEREVLEAAHAVRALGDLRMELGAGGRAELRLSQGTLLLDEPTREAVLGLLIERHTAFLVGLGITPDQPAA